VYRPAAKDQLRILAAGLGTPFYTSDSAPRGIAMEAHSRAKLENWDTLVVDTAGRLQIDLELMDELEQLKSALQPAEILYVADAMSGQEAVHVAEAFHARLGVTG